MDTSRASCECKKALTCEVKFCTKCVIQHLEFSLACARLRCKILEEENERLREGALKVKST